MRLRLKYVHAFTDRLGRKRYYFRRGKARVALPDPAKSFDAFMVAYQAAERGVPRTEPGPRRLAPEGSLAQVIDLYMKSRAFTELKPNSQKTYQSGINFLMARPSAFAHVAAFDADNIEELLDDLAADKPGMALLVLKVFRVLFPIARRKKWLVGDPLQDIRPPKGGSYQAWNDAELLRFEQRWPSGTTERLVYELALRTGQRRGDIAKMTWADVKGGKVEVVQQKTGEMVKARIHPVLARELDPASRSTLTIVATETGLPFKPHYLGVWFARAIEEAGLPDECVMHGLRKTFTKKLAEKGATDRQIMAATGHTTTQMVTLYTRQADRERLADEAGKIAEQDDE